MRNRYLVVSDLHLCDVEDHADGWKAYKHAKYVFDDALDSLLARFASDAPDGTASVLILNGDIFDFDLITDAPTEAPFTVSRWERRRGLRPSALKSAWKLEHMLSFHRPFIESLARFLAASPHHSLVYVFGNHDREFYFEEVQKTFLDAVQSAAAQASLTIAADAIRFEPWFYYVPGEIYAEHGNQYDRYTSFRHVLAPVVDHQQETELALPMGNLSNRLLMTRMGFFNPHASDYILNVYRYVAHWLRHYAFSSRSLALSWFVGSFVVMSELLDTKRLTPARSPSADAALATIAERNAVPKETLIRLLRLQHPPITARFFGIVRELWIDRVLVMFLLAAATLTLALVPIPLWIKLMLPLSVFPLVFLIYEELVKGETIFTVEHRVPEYARSVGAILPVRLVTFGHTHTPRVIPLDPKLVFVDTGTWAPIMRRLDDAERLVPGYRNYMVADFTGEEPVIQLRCWGAEGRRVSAEAAGLAPPES